MLLLILCTFSISEFKVDTQVYKGFYKGYVAVNNNQIYVLNSTECKFSKYDFSGNKIGEFGRSGKGPGEFVKPFGFSFLNNLIYVYELNHVEVVDCNGVFKKRVKIPQNIRIFKKAKKGWLGITGLTQFSEKNKCELIWFNADLSTTKILFQWTEVVPACDIGTYNPFEDYTKFVINNRLTHAYLKPKDNNVIITYNIEEDLISTILIPGSQVPLNKEFKTLYYNSRKKDETSLKVKFPKYFPLIFSIAISAEDHLVVRKWTPDMFALPSFEKLVELEYVLTFDKNGNKIAPTISDRFIDQIFYVNKERGVYYYISHDEELDSYLLNVVNHVNALKKIGSNCLNCPH